MKLVLFPETVADRGFELESEAALKQPDVGLRSISKKASEMADSEVGLGFTRVELCLARVEPLLRFPPPPPRGDLELKTRLCVECWIVLELSSLTMLIVDTETRPEPGLVAPGRRS